MSTTYTVAGFARTIAGKLQWRKGLTLQGDSEQFVPATKATMGEPCSTTDAEAQVVTSIIEGSAGPWGAPRHAVVLDLDVPAMLVPSSTPGHSHLYIDVSVEGSDYRELLRLLAKCGVIENGYYKASSEKGFTAVRLPWVKKAR